MTEASTKESILAAAEQLYTEKGFTGTSIRAITTAAGVNTAAIHYHFGSKEALIEALIARRAKPVNQARLERLDRIEAEHPEGLLPLEEVIEAFLGPALRLRAEAGGNDLLPRLMARFAMEAPGGEMQGIVRNIFGEIRQRFVPALCRALPGVPEEEVLWRMHMMIGSMCFAVAVPGGHIFPCNTEREVQAQELLDRLVQFSAAGMRGHSPEPAGDEKK
jgi:AcrR family transcriptional regulator